MQNTHYCIIYSKNKIPKLDKKLPVFPVQWLPVQFPNGGGGGTTVSSVFTFALYIPEVKHSQITLTS